MILNILEKCKDIFKEVVNKLKGSDRKENNDPSISAVSDNAGGYEKALLKTLPSYIEKVKAGRKKR